MSFLETDQGRKLFELYLKKFKGKSSQKVYRSEITQFFDFYRGDLAGIHDKAFIQYRNHLGQNVKAATMKRKFSILNQFFKFLETGIKGFRSPIGQTYGDMKTFQAADYLDSDAFRRQMGGWIDTLVCDSTKKTYAGHVRLFFKWAGKEPKDLAHDDFVRYRDHLLIENRRKPSTVWNKFVAVNGFLKYLAGKSRKFKNPMVFRAMSLVPPKKDKGYYTVMTLKEAQKLLRQPDQRTLIGKRDHAVLRMMLTYGLRVNEVCKLRFQDLERERVKGQQKLWVRDRKGHIGRRADTDIILSGKALEAFDGWVNACGIRFEPDTPLFVGFIWDVSAGGLEINYSRLRDKKPLTVKTIENMVGKYVAAAGIDNGDRVISPHALRHTALTLLAKEGIELIDLKFIAGHQDVSTTMIYLHSVQSYNDHVGLHSPINI
ncbi:MAG: hypothetical protein C4518_15110 [Desulfobacteraceae bacterium]|nr:MAG: hypothetical protein C4518_15110 [Desulfobacteraceae bacterium]